ncbi:protein EMSY-LIKE 1 isoform X3 [Ziziphus jujuba]|uniref:Protein EMSY-LIKE 1 isoform X3 n=1 Tax=Ziziphus jujuba TaxID=326968 RepID=A0ABM3ZW85_ZIZJJ|nr:protein EMSY-LIKE 1 isoform X3 [Ziziphus jujuba var. spinosa]XP_060668751.1 protein EMSY-LIKE 1 isoform X3 [Ziziphus jujuba]
MDFDVSDSSGTDDDNPPSHQNRVPRGSRVAGIARSAVGSISHTRMHTDMEAQIHHLEQEAYCAVLRAFQAQSDAISWEKESLLTELRNELRVSNDSHRELLTRVNEDDIIRKLREWRKSGGLQATRLSTSLPAYDLLPSPTNSASRKKQKTSQLQVQQFPSLSSVKSMRYPSTEPARNRQLINRSSLGGHAVNEHPEAATFDPLIGRKVWTRWPADNSFYEALVTDYDAAAISPEDIRWEGEEMVTSHHGAHNGQGRGVKKSLNRGGRIPNNGRVRGPLKSQSMKDSLPSQNGISKKVSDDIELLNTDSLVKEVEMVFNTSHPDPFELEKAKKMLKEHEQALVDAIAKLAYASDGESDGEHAYTYGQSMDRG